jgi:hypothetical protein
MYKTKANTTTQSVMAIAWVWLSLLPIDERNWKRKIHTIYWTQVIMRTTNWKLKLPKCQNVKPHQKSANSGAIYSYIRVMPHGFLLKSVVPESISKEVRRAEHEYMNIPLPQLTF